MSEGHEVRLYIDEPQSRECFNGIVEKVSQWRDGIDWAGKDGLIIFDDAGYGIRQDELRAEGYCVVGGCAEADRIELDREYGQQIFKKYGLQTATLVDFSSIKDAIEYVREHPRKWVIKRNGSVSKQLYYAGDEDDGSDVITLLQQYEHEKREISTRITLHERVEGVEFGVGRYFNGEEWIGPIELNVEHPRLYPGGLGPITNEMGTLAWYTDDERNKLYLETIAKLKPYLQKIKFKGDFALNCIVNERGAFILEATPRFGSPILHLQQQIHRSPWGEFLLALAKGDSYKLEWNPGYGIVVLVAVPPFPYVAKEVNRSSYGLTFDLGGISRAQLSQVAFEEVARREEDKNQLYIADQYGYVAYVSAVARTIPRAQQAAYGIISKLNIPRMFYRHDIGSQFLKQDRKILKDFGYL